MTPSQNSHVSPDPAAMQRAEDVLLAAVSCAADPDARARLEALVPNGIDWALLLRLSKRHGVAPLLDAAISRHDLRRHVPSTVAEALSEAASTAAAASLLRDQAAAESVQALDAGGYRPIIIRGPVLAHEYYEDASLRPSADIDILVPPERWPDLLDDVRRWQHAVESVAFRVSDRRCDLPAHLDPARLNDPSFHRWLQDECAPWRIETASPWGILFEFHFDLFPHCPHDAGVPDLWTTAERVLLPGTTVRTLGRPELLIELCFHAMKHYAWRARLIWFCDIDRVVRRDATRIDWDRLFQRAHELGARTSVFYALKLAADLLDTPVPAAALASAQPSGIRARLVARSWPKYLRPLLRRVPPGCPFAHQWAADPWGALTSRFSVEAAAQLARALWPSRDYLYLRYGVKGALRSYLYHLRHLAKAPMAAAAVRRAQGW